MKYHFCVAIGVQTTRGAGFGNVYIVRPRKLQDWTFQDYQEITDLVQKEDDTITGVAILNVMEIKEG